jgi:hypothetical protein
VHHQTAQRCVERALVCGPIEALEDRPRPGKERSIPAEAKARLVALACHKPKEPGYPHELWTTRLLARHAREHGPAEDHTCLAKLAPGTVPAAITAAACRARLQQMMREASYSASRSRAVSVRSAMRTCVRPSPSRGRGRSE